MDTSDDDASGNGNGGDKRNGNSLDKSIQQCDSLIIATRYDPSATLLRLLPYLAPSCPFVVYHEFLEPLLEVFRTLQNYHAPDAGATENGEGVDQNAGDGDDDGGRESTTPSSPMMLRRNVAINLRLTDCWFREYQVLDGRTHPAMSMSQNGGYVLAGTKLCPRTGTNELDEEDLREIRARVGGRRKRQGRGGGGGKRKRKKGADVSDDKKSPT
ncbi:hypothetical protein ACHAWF_000368 [Thalassiosira exigua]